jgi:transglutaminase-like putative cysteine protease
MNPSYKLIAFILIFLANQSIAQITENPKEQIMPTVQFGKINVADFTTPNMVDSNTVAAVLYEKGSSYYVSEASVMKLVHERHVRIKILSEKAVQWTRFEIPTYRPRGTDQEEKIETIEGYTHILKDGKIIRHKLEAQDVFTVRPVPDVEIMRFIMPYCEVGAIVEYRYKMVSDFIFNLQGWEFQKEIPILWSEYEVKVPEYLSFLQFSQGYETFTIEKQSQEKDYFSFGGMLNTADIGVYQWAVKNIAAFEPLPFMENPADNITKIDFLLQGFKFPFMSKREENLTTWEQVYKELKKDDKITGFVKRTSEVKEITQTLIANQSSETQKMQAIFDYVKKNIKWNGEFSRWASVKNPEKVLAAKKGNTADINLLLVTMCKQAGLNANPLVLARKETGKAYPKQPRIDRMNMVVAGVVADNQTYKLDATQPFTTPIMLPLACLNGNGLLVADEMQLIKLLPDIESRKTVEGNFSLQITENMPNNTKIDLKGQVNITEKGYITQKSRNTIANQSKELFIQQSLLTENKGVSMENIVIANENIPEEDLKASATLTTRNQAQIAVTKNGSQTHSTITFNPLLFLQETQSPFTQIERKYPIDFVFPFIEDYTMRFAIPTGYSVETLPKTEEFTFLNSEIVYRYEVTESNNQIIVKHLLSVSTAQVLPKNYAFLREFWGKIVKKHQEQIVLKKTK